MNEMIARVAKAIAFAEGRENQAPSYALAAFAAIAAMREPTEEMREAFYKSCDEHGQVLWRYGYRAMIDEALKD